MQYFSLQFGSNVQAFLNRLASQDLQELVLLVSITCPLSVPSFDGLLSHEASEASLMSGFVSTESLNFDPDATTPTLSMVSEDSQAPFLESLVK